MTTALLTSPLDVLRTRLQSDYYRAQLAPQPLFRNTSPAGSFGFLRTSLNHFRETIYILSSIPRVEGWRGLFRGLGPGLTGVVPASGIKFYTYGNGKRIISENLSLPDDAAIVHIGAAAFSGIATGSATNPIWLVKTRLQLDNSRLEEGSIRQRRYKNSLDCIAQIFRQEGIRGFYRGLSASYLGVAESTLHLTLYEQLKIFIRRQRTVHSDPLDTQWNSALDWAEAGGAAAASKVVAGTLGYPHEVGNVILVTLGQKLKMGLGSQNSITASSHGKRSQEIHRPGPVLPAHVEARGPSGHVWRSHRTSPTSSPQRRHHAWCL